MSTATETTTETSTQASEPSTAPARKSRKAVPTGLPTIFTTTHGELSAALDAMTALAGRGQVLFARLVQISEDFDGKIRLESYDYDTYVAVELSGRSLLGAGRSSVLVDRALLTGYIRSLTAGSTKAKQAGLPIRFEIDGAVVGIQADGYSFNLPTVTQEFPHAPGHHVGALVTVDRDEMLAALTRLQVCASADTTLPMLTGVHVASVPGGLELCTTDRFRLGLAFVGAAGAEPAKEIDRLLPAKLTSKVLRYLPAGEVVCAFPEPEDPADAVTSLVWFLSGGVRIAVKCVDGKFPSYHKLLPTKWTGEAVVPRAELAVAIKRAAASVDRGHSVRLTLAGSTAVVTAGGDEGSVASRPLRTEQTGEDASGPIGFNPAQLGDALTAFGSDAVAIRYSAPGRPVLIAEPGELDNPRAFRTLVMPMRLGG